MSKQASPEQIVEKTRPAVQAWLRLHPGSSEPSGITLLKNTLRSTVCRIEGIGPGGSGIVAKRCPRAEGELEAFIYREVLDRLSIEAVRCYGFFEEGSGEYGWLFLEDGGIKRVADKGESFPIAFAHWLALLHGSASNLPIRGRLPERGPAWYLEVLRTARRGLCQGLSERNWGELDRPAIETTLVCFEVFGWGTPAADLAEIDAVSYWSTARKTWASIELRRVEEQVRCGVLFKILLAVGWEMIRLAAGSEEKAMRRLRIYAPRLAAGTQALGLEV